MNYADKNESQIESRLEMLSYALCYENNYLNYNLIGKDELEKYIFFISDQNYEIELKIKKDFYITLLKTEDMANKFIDKDKERFFWETYSDFVYGYCLKISKELLSIA